MLQTKYAGYIRRCTVSKLLQERWMRLAFAKDSTTVSINEADEAHKNSKIYDDCWDGYVKVAGKERGEDGSCEKKTESDETLSEDKDRPGMWYYINKNKAEGKPPKKPGEEGYPSEKAWKENTKKEASDPLDETTRCSLDWKKQMPAKLPKIANHIRSQ